MCIGRRGGGSQLTISSASSSSISTFFKVDFRSSAVLDQPPMRQIRRVYSPPLTALTSFSSLDFSPASNCFKSSS